MNMKRINLLTVFLLLSYYLSAQNPFAQYGYTKVKIGTMTNGRYNEFFDNDTIMQIGSVIINTNTGKIVSFIVNNDTTNILPEPQIMSRWISPDPLAEKYWSISPYSYCNNNPLKYIDPNGMYFTGATDWLDRFTQRINSDMQSNGNKINNLESQIKDLREAGDNKKADKLQEKVDKLVVENASLQGIVGEIDALTNSNQEYRIENGSNLPNDAAATTTFNFSDNAVVLTIDKEYGLDAFAHDLKHCYQFETGKIDLREGGKAGILFWDKTDEREANQRGNMFGKTFTPETGTPYERSILPNYTDSQINATYKRLNATDKHAYRLNNKTYIYVP
jgi:hypothetical protein